MRTKTYFGVIMPPKKRKKMGAGTTTIRFVIKGRVPSKKNNQQSVTVRKDAIQWMRAQQKSGRSATWDDVKAAIGMTYSKMRGNTAYNEFVAKVKPVLQEQAAEWSKRLAGKGLVFPLNQASLSLTLYFKDRYITDTVNKQQTIQDVLIEAGIIANDDYKTLNPIYSEAESYYEEITDNIAFISLSFRL
jgi:hypothetical protein